MTYVKPEPISIFYTEVSISDFLKQLSGGLDRRIAVDGKPYTYFSGTDYLGISQHPDFINLYVQGVKKWGTNNGTSRNGNVQMKIYEEAESFAASLFHSEDSIICSSGFLAAQMAVRCFQDFGELVYGPGSHPALWLHDLPNTQHLNFNEWARLTVRQINQSSENKFVVIANAVDIFAPSCHSFTEFRHVSPEKNIVLIVDDSHGIGLTGTDGSGIYKELPHQPNIKVLVVASMAKGLGIRAGIILGKKELLSEIRQKGMYVGASPATPASIQAFAQAGAIYAHQLKLLKENIQYFIGKTGNSFSHDPQLPIFVARVPSLYDDLLSKKIVISSFPYPGMKDPLFSRIVLSAAHHKEDVDLLTTAIKANSKG